MQLQAYFLVLDDVMDNSHTRRGQPCWFKVPKVWAKSQHVAVYFSYFLLLPVKEKHPTCVTFMFQVGMIALNDGILLRNHVRRILRKHFRDKPYYAHLLDLFDEVIYLYSFCLICSHLSLYAKSSLPCVVILHRWSFRLLQVR